MVEDGPPSFDGQDQETRMLRDNIRRFMAEKLTESYIADCEAAGELPWEMTVSYTHLTLPTICSV